MFKEDLTIERREILKEAPEKLEYKHVGKLLE